MNNEGYGPSWIKLSLMINEDTKEIHVIGGDQEPGQGDMPYIGLELLKEWDRDGKVFK